MDECLNDDDDEEPHRVFFDCFDAQGTTCTVHAGNGRNKRVTAVRPYPSRRPARHGQIRFFIKPVRAGPYGRLTGQ